MCRICMICMIWYAWYTQVHMHMTLYKHVQAMHQPAAKDTGSTTEWHNQGFRIHQLLHLLPICFGCTDQLEQIGFRLLWGYHGISTIGWKGFVISDPLDTSKGSCEGIRLIIIARDVWFGFENVKSNCFLVVLGSRPKIWWYIYALGKNWMLVFRSTSKHKSAPRSLHADTP